MVNYGVVVVLVALTVPQGAPPPEPAVPGIPGSAARQDSVQAVLSRYAQSVGGERLRLIRSETRRGTLVRGSTGRVPVEVFSAPPGRWHWSQSFSWGDRLAFGFDGRQGWVQDGEGVASMTARQALDFQLLFGITAPLELQEIFSEFSLRGSEEIDGRPASVLVGRTPDGMETELAFDRDAGLLRRVNNTRLEEYREVDGMTRPFRLRVGEILVVQFAEIRHDLPVDEALFHQPQAPLPPIDPVLYRRHEEAELAPAALEACVGEYELPGGVVLTVAREGGHLMLQTPGSLRYEIFPVSDRFFVMRFNHLELHFLTDDSGKVDRLSLGADSSRVATRIR